MNLSCANLIVNSMHLVVLCQKLKSEGKQKTDNVLLENYFMAIAVDNAEQICVWRVSPVVTRRSKTAFTRRGWTVFAHRILVAESLGGKNNVRRGMCSTRNVVVGLSGRAGCSERSPAAVAATGRG